MNVALLDNRVAYGARCTWWDSIRKVGKSKPGLGGHRLPCCPHCRGMLFEMENEGQWFAGVEHHEKNGNPGYRAMVEWGRGKCYKNYDELARFYKENAALTRDQFIEAMCARAVERNWPDAKPQAEQALADFLRDEKIEYGDHGHGWTMNDAHLFADEMLFRE